MAETRWNVVVASLVLTLSLAGQSQWAQADNHADKKDKAVDARLNVRYRFEGWEQENRPEDASAHTVRTRLTLKTRPVGGFSFLGEIDNVSNIGSERFNSTENGRTQYPVVADPSGTDLNQAFVKYAGNDYDFSVGRQRVSHGDQRFLGSVPWRQNEATFDALRYVYSGVPGLKLDYSFAKNLYRIFGPDDGPVQPGRWSGDFHLMRADYKVNKQHSLTGFAYLLDVDLDPAYPAGRTLLNSSNTWGAEYKGSFGKAGVRLTLAQQNDGGDSTLDYSANYYLGEVKYNFGPVTANAVYEVLGSDNGVGFKLPLSTLRKFNGWGDLFLATPGDGLRDFYVGATGKAGPVKLLARYHDFEADEGGTSFGTEVDLSATWPVDKHWNLQLQFADFSSDTPRLPDRTGYFLIVNWKS